LSREDVLLGNPFVHAELLSRDDGKSRKFYGKLSDWKLEDMQMENGTFTMIVVGEGTGGEVMKNPMPGGSSSWVAKEEVDRSLR
jgi:predicted enzyme related to lactoylglutathione lyase